MSKPLEGDQLKQITNRLDAIIRLLATSLPDTIKQREKIKLLLDSGLQPKEIGPILGILPNTVSTVLFQIKKDRERTESKSPDTSPTPSFNEGQGGAVN